MERANASAARRSVLPIRIVNLINAESNHAYQRAPEWDVPLYLSKDAAKVGRRKEEAPRRGPRGATERRLVPAITAALRCSGSPPVVAMPYFSWGK